MLARCLAVLFIPILPFVPLFVPLSSAHAISAVVAGIVATALVAFALVDDRARTALAAVGAWVALSPFIFDSTMLEKVLTVSWGVVTFVHMIGPFADPPRVETSGAPATHMPPVNEEAALPRAA